MTKQSRIPVISLAIAGAVAIGCGGERSADPGDQAKRPAIERKLDRTLPSAVVEPKEMTAPVPVAAPTPVAPVAPEKSLEQLVRDGKKASSRGDHEAAIEMLETAVDREPGAATARIELARALIVANRVAEARSHAETAVEILPNSSYAWNTLGRVELGEGKLEAAITSFERAAEENDDNYYAWNNLGLTLIKLQRWEEAVTALEMATSGDRPTAYMWNNLATAYEKLDRLDEARAAYRQAEETGSAKAAASLARLEGVESLAVPAPDSDELAELGDVTESSEE